MRPGRKQSGFSDSHLSSGSSGTLSMLHRGSIDAVGVRTPSTSSKEDLFNCLLCVEQFRKPKILDCQHAFCEHCLQLYYKTYKGIQYEQQGVFVPCPTCRKLSKVPTEGLVSLDHDYYDDRMVELKRKMSTITGISIQRCDICVFKNKLEESEFYCSKCSMNFCANCKVVHGQEPLFKTHAVIHISNKETIQLSCESHNKQPSHYYCHDCHIPLCVVCVMHEHSSHQTVKLIEALAMRRDNIKTLLNILGPKMDKTEAKVKKLAYLYSMKSRGPHIKNGITMSRSMSVANDMTNSVSGGGGHMTGGHMTSTVAPPAGGQAAGSAGGQTRTRKYSLMEISDNKEAGESEQKVQNYFLQVRICHVTPYQLYIMP